MPDSRMEADNSPQKEAKMIKVSVPKNVLLVILLVVGAVIGALIAAGIGSGSVLGIVIGAIVGGVVGYLMWLTDVVGSK